ncbi:neutrophil gelatinase-associated lipocalin isoform X2 [Denticeps clupeoides]|uniref:neutrophil gelatinase-associated lipocalin isoform X2 n=1 Tax=Denticeps clupeoides TaxID=299321 RepID=UPI0010A52268|nr:neutrophil gelatinase-associated lipocalin isoform X2 [Denticeps clupeoides]
MPVVVALAAAMLLLAGTYADVQPQKNFDLQKFSGKWYRVGLAYDSPGFIPYRERFKISMGTVDPQPGGNVSMTMWSIGSSGCRSTVYFYEKTSLPGMFTYFSTRHNMVKDITVVDTNYTDYAIVFKYKKMDKEYSQVALYGRNQKLKPELLKKFKDFSLAHGFPRESILTPTKAENCSSPGK